MTQEATPVGGEPIAPEPTLEDRIITAAIEDEPEQEGEAPEEAEGDEPEADEPEIEAEDLPPPIDPPSSWTAEEKAKFSELPREVQETVTRRESEREKFVQTKAQEASQARQSAAREAAEILSQAHERHAQQLEQYARQLAVNPPDARLYAANPQAYADQLEAYQHYTAQRQAAQQEAQEARQQAAQYEKHVQEQEAIAFRQHIETELPEFYDETAGPRVKNDLTTTAKFLGFSDEEIFSATSGQIVALKRISDVKAKADKYDKLMAKQMERVRAGKGKELPPVSKPGVAQPPGANRRAQYEADRNAMRRGDKDAAKRVFSTFL